MKEIRCPVCNSVNSEDAESCRVCGVTFDRLPKDILPDDETNPPAANLPDPAAQEALSDQDASIPKWLSDIMQRNKKNQGKMEFESFADVIFGKETGAGPKSVRKDDLSGNEKIEDLLPPRRQSIQELSDVPLEIPENAEVPSDDAEDDEKYADFTYFRPAAKLDDVPLQAATQTPGPSPDVSDDEPENASDGLENVNPINDIAPPSIEPTADDEPASAADLPDKQPEPTAAAITTAEKRVEEPAESENQPANVSVSAQPPANESTEQFPSIERDEPESIPTRDEAEPEETALPESDDLIEPAEPNLVSEFLATLKGPEPAENENPDQPAMEAEAIETDDTTKPVFPENAEETDAAASEAPETGISGEIPDEIPAEVTPSIPETEPESETEVSITPGIVTDKNERDLDTIPWNLFETGDMSIPYSHPEAEYKTFSRSQILPDHETNNYQQRMILAVLQKLFRLESQISPLEQPAGRKTGKLLQAVLALIALAGIITLLATGVTDFIRLNPVNSERLPGLTAFSDQITGLNSGDQALLILDYPPGYGNELLAPSQALVEKIAAQEAGIHFVTTSPLAEINAQKLLRDFSATPIENIGYLPGTAAAIQWLLQSETVRMDKIFIVSSNFESLQLWIEQLSLSGISAPVNIIASAQMSPLLRPYLDAGDIDAGGIDAGGIDSLISGTVEKSVFTGNDFSDSYENRKLFGVWFLCLFALLIFFTGSLEAAAEKTISGASHPTASGKASGAASASFQNEAPSDSRFKKEQGDEK